MQRIPLVLGPKAIIWAADIPIPVERFQEAQKKALHIYIFGTATYRDVFDHTPKRRRRWRFVNSG